MNSHLYDDEGNQKIYPKDRTFIPAVKDVASEFVPDAETEEVET
jgi:hypothetical protein